MKASEGNHLQRQYWKFFWPLTLTGVAMLLARQFQNGALARFENAAEHLKVFALASGVFFLFNAALVFIPQMANALAKSRQNNFICLRFTIAVCAIISLPMCLAAYTYHGNLAVAWVYGIDDLPTRHAVVYYLQLLTPLIFVNGLRQYYTGLLVQAKHTFAVTILNVIYLASVIAILVIGFQQQWEPTITIVGAQFGAALLHLVLSFFAHIRNNHIPLDNGENNHLTYRQTFAFFWPVAITSTMFALSRPVIYSFVNRIPDPIEATATIAALRVAFDLGMIFQNSINQFRHFFVTFADEDIQGVRQFMITVCILITALMVLVVFTPLCTFILDDLLNVKGHLLVLSRQVLMVLCLTPTVISFRNYYHGLALVEKRTRSMAVGGIMRVVMIYFACQLLISLELLNHISAAFVLILGFLAEAMVVLIATRSWREQEQITPVLGDENEI